jgi:hypothetical protein
MLVRLEVTASEKVAARSQYEPNGYSVLVSVENLEVQHADELQAQAETLFRRAKEAIQTAKREDGIGMKVEEAKAKPRTEGPPASSKQVELIQQLAKRAGMDEPRLKEFADQAVGGVEGMTKFDASRLINALQHVPINGRHR